MSIALADDTAGDFRSRVSRRLGVKIVGLGVENHGFAQYLPHMEPPGEDLQIGPPKIPQHGRQISRVVGMERVPRVKMASAFREPLPGAATARVNVKGEKARFCPGQSPNPDLHQNSVRPLVKPHHTPNLRVVLSPAQIRNGIRPSCLLHTITPASLCGWDDFVCGDMA